MKILLATDGSETAEAAVDFLARFPFPKQSEVTMLTVIREDIFEEKDVEGLSEELRQALKETQESVREEGEQLIAGEVDRLRKAGWAGSTEVRFGHPAHEIVRAAADLKVDLLVVGSHGLKGMRRFLLGSVSHNVLHYAPCSVLIVKTPAAPVEGEKTWRVLLAYDNSEPAKKAVELCASLPIDEKVAVNALSVLPLVKLYRQDIRQRLSSFWHQKKKAAQAALEWVTKEVRWTTPNVSAEIRESSDVAQEILDDAARYNSDLIILGDKGKSAIEKFLVGTVTNRVARHAPCSVWVVRN